MGYISEDIVERIKGDTDILDLIGEYVNLKKAGKDYIGLCPFHREKTPSFTVVPAKGFYHCFGCGASGNAIGFIMRHENLDYPEALKFLAKRAGITIPETTSAADSPATRLYHAIEYAHSFFKMNLKNSAAYEYVKNRGVTNETITEMELGYAPNGWDNLYQALKKDKLSPADFEQAGLLVKNDKGGYYDKFRHRLIFPIKNISARTIGFGGRALSNEDTPKYLNSPETPIYHKGSVLYGLHLSKNYIRNSGKAIITEGYLDFISMYQAGIKNVVAMSGTGFTLNQGSLLARFCNTLVLLYDADSAGMKATFRAVEIIYNSGLEPYVVRLPKGDDPDSFVRTNGGDAMKVMINGAVDYLEFVKNTIPDKFSALPISRQERVIKSLVETAMGIDDELKYELFVRKAAETLDLPSAAVSKFQKVSKHKTTQNTIELPDRIRIENQFLGFLFANPEFIKDGIQTLKSENFVDIENQKIFLTLKSVNNAAKFSVGDLLEQFLENGIRRKITEIILNETAGAPPEMRYAEYIVKFKQLQISDKLELLLSEITKAEREGDFDNAEKLTREYQDLRNSASRKVV